MGFQDMSPPSPRPAGFPNKVTFLARTPCPSTYGLCSEWPELGLSDIREEGQSPLQQRKRGSVLEGFKVRAGKIPLVQWWFFYSQKFFDTFPFRRQSLIPLAVNVAQLSDLLPSSGGSDRVWLLWLGHEVPCSFLLGLLGCLLWASRHAVRMLKQPRGQLRGEEPTCHLGFGSSGPI